MLNRQARFITTPVAIGLAAAVVCCGCSRPPDPHRFIPASEQARAALEAVLVDWQAGLPCGMIERQSVHVYPIDNQRKKDQELSGFEILGEAPRSGVRCFAVRLTYQNPAGAESVRYVVHGIDPLYVYREEDFDLLNHWDHLMPAEPDPAAPQSGAAPPDATTAADPGEKQQDSQLTPDQSDADRRTDQ